MFDEIACQEGDIIFIAECIKIIITKVEDKRVHITVYAPAGVTLIQSKSSENEYIQTAIDNDIEIVITTVTTNQVDLDKTTSADVIIEHEALSDKLN